jgi:hypothetical protein
LGLRFQISGGLKRIKGLNGLNHLIQCLGLRFEISGGLKGLKGLNDLILLILLITHQENKENKYLFSIVFILLDTWKS